VNQPPAGLIHSFFVEPHPKLLHYPAGSIVTDLMDADYLRQSKLDLTEIEHRSCRFGRIAVAPTLAFETPAKLNGGHYIGKEGWLCQPCEANQLTVGHYLDREEAIALLFPSSFEREDAGCSLLDSAGVARTDVAHHLGVTAHSRERFNVVASPAPKHQPACSDLRFAHAFGYVGTDNYVHSLC
jgi:hypothetical protein